jgi:hypothetical protein
VRGLAPSSYTVFLLLIGLVVTAGMILVYRLRRDVEEDCPVSEADVLRDLERAYYAGEMDEAEFRRVTAALKRPKGPAAPPPPPVTPADPPEAEGSAEPDVEANPA